MARIEGVISWLESLMDIMKPETAVPDNKVIPSSTSAFTARHIAEVIDAARVLLVELKPRLLTDEDFMTDLADSGGAIPCWKEPKSQTRREGWAVIVYGKWLADKPYARYWTTKPTDEQKKAEAWP